MTTNTTAAAAAATPAFPHVLSPVQVSAPSAKEAGATS